MNFTTFNISTNKTKFFTILYILFFIASVVGSNLYIIDTMISTKNQLFILIPLMLLFLTGCITFILQIPEMDIEIVKDFFYFSFLPVILIFSLLICNNDNKLHMKLFYRASIFIFYLLFATVIYELYTGNHLPAHSEDLAQKFVPSAFFTNSNDLSVFTLALFLAFTVLNKYFDSKFQYLLITFITGFIIFVTLSRSSLLVFILYFIFSYLKKISFKRSLILVFSLIIIINGFILIHSKLQTNETYNRALSRVESISNISLKSETKDVSSNLRFSIYKIPFMNFSKFIIGNGFNSDEEVMKYYDTGKLTNSHSFLIQLIFYFGWLGFILLLSFFLSIIIYVIINNKNNFQILFFIFAQLIIINIPSSIIRMPVIWLPFFYIIALITSYQNLHEKSLPSYKRS